MKLFNIKQNKNKRKFLRNNSTKAETVLWQELRNKQLGFKFRRQHGIGHYIVDFYCPKLKLVIEADGEVHELSSVIQNDNIRQKFLEGKGFCVKRYYNFEIFEDVDSVVQDIYNTCIQLTSPGPSLERMGIVQLSESPPKIRGRVQRGLI